MRISTIYLISLPIVMVFQVYHMYTKNPKEDIYLIIARLLLAPYSAILICGIIGHRLISNRTAVKNLIPYYS